VVALATVVTALAAAPPATALDLAPCPGRSGIQCGTLTVPLDRTGATPGTTPLRVHRLPARTARRGTVLLLPDGPGRAALTPGREDGSMRTIARAARGYDVVLLDPRGTGPDAFDCPDVAGALRGAVPLATARARVAACAASLGPRGAFAGSAVTAQDLEQLRAELGVEWIVVAAVGYGAVPALEYARTHPDRVARIVLDAPVDPEALDGLDLEALRTVPAVLAEICVRRTCRAATTTPAADLARVERLLRTRPLTGTVALPNGRRARAAFGGPRQPRALLELLAASDRLPAVRAGLPAALRAAARGDGAPLLRLASRVAAVTVPVRALAPATRLATGCRDARLPWSDATPEPDRIAALAAAAGALGDDAAAPFGRAAVLGGSLAALCTAWPHGPQAASTAPLPDVPVLVLAGREDARGGTAVADRVAARFPSAQRVDVPHGGHALLATRACARTAMQRFLGGRPAGTPCRSGGRSVIPPPWAPATLAGTRPAPFAAGTRGRTLRAVAIALEDAVFAARLAEGTAARGRLPLAALRSGRATARARGGRLTITLARWSAVRGVTLTGTVSVVGGTVNGDPIRVAGRGSRGTLQATSGFLVGFLGGEPVVLDIAGLLGGGSA